MAVASLVVVAGAIQAEIAGLATMALIAAGSTLTSGAISMLTQPTDKDVPIFESFQVTVDLSSEFSGLDRYILLHRGDSNIKESELSIIQSNSGAEIQRNNSFFDDGAWILFRIQKSNRYAGDPLPWFADAEAVKNTIEEQIRLWESNSSKADDVKAALVANGKEPATVGDKYIAICRRIQADLVLTKFDRIANAGNIKTYYAAAQEALKDNDPQTFDKIRDKTAENLTKGIAPPAPIATLYREILMNSRSDDLVRALSLSDKKETWKSLSIK
jgi:hypothetical protein